MRRGKGKKETRQEHNPVKAPSAEAANLAAMLAPLEEQQEGKDSAHTNPRNNGGAIVIDTAQLNLPKDLIDEAERQNPFGLEPVVIFILLLMLVFIAFIAFLIYLEPAR